MLQKELAKEVGQRFRNFRVSQGLRQKEMSALLGVSHSNISRLERGVVCRISIDFLNDFRTKFGLSTDWLLTGQGLMTSAEAEVKARQATLSRRKGRKRLIAMDQRELQRKLDELTATLVRAARLVQQLFAYASTPDTQGKKK